MNSGSRVIAVSVSEASNLGHLGFLPNELDRVLAALITSLIHGGFRIAYGGRLEGRDNFTTGMSAQVAETYAPKALTLGARPFIHVWAPHRVAALPRESLIAHAQILGPHAELWLMGAGESVRGMAGLATRSVNGTVVTGVHYEELSKNDPRGVRGMPAERPGEGGPAGTGSFAASDADLLKFIAEVAREAAASVAQDEVTAPSFTRMRRMMAQLTDARIIVGGRTAGFSGPISGVTEEAVITIEAGKPLLILGAFGGAARDIAIALGLLKASHDNLTDKRYMEGIDLVHKWEGKYRQLMGEAGLEQVAVELAGADTHTIAARLTMMALRRLFPKDR